MKFCRNNLLHLLDGSSLITAGVQNGDVVVQSYALQPSGAPLLAATRDLGAIGQGSLAGVSVNQDGSIVVAAGSPDADWALNLLADPACRVTLGDASWAATATPLEGVEHADAVRSLILRYGTPAENLGAGPSFELRRVEA